MENNWFSRPGDLEDNKPNINGSSFFKPAGSLAENPTKTNEALFRPAAGALDTPKSKNSFNFEEKKEPSLKTPEEIKAWLKTIVSGEKKEVYGFGEGPQVTSSGNILVRVDELKEMVQNGDNIIKAEYFEALNMVNIEFQSFSIPGKSR